MADSVFDLSFNVDSRSLDRGLSKLNQGLNQAQKNASSLGGLINQAFAVFASTAAVKSLILTGDAFLNIQNRLRTVASDSLAFSVTYQQLADVAQRTRTSFETNIELFQRLSATVQSLNIGISRGGLISVMETLNKAVSLSGASAIEAAQAIRQLSQGIASGALKGDELRSVLEQLPTIADIIARRLGVTRGQLKDLGERSQITSRVIIEAFQAARKEIDEKFANAIPTIGQAFTQLRNSFILVVGDLQNATGVFSVFASVILTISENLRSVGAALVTVAEVVIGGLVVKSILRATAAWATYKAAAIAASTTTVTALGSFSNGVSTLTTTVTRGTASFKDFIRSAVNNTGALIAAAAAIGFAVQSIMDSFAEEAKLTTNFLDELAQEARELTPVGSQLENLRKQVEAAIGRPVDSAVEEQIKALRLEIERTAKAQTPRPKFIAHLTLLEKKLRLAKESAIDFQEAQTKIAKADFTAATTKLQREIELLGRGNREREIQLELDKQVAALTKKKAAPDALQTRQLEQLIRQKKATEEMAAVVEEIVSGRSEEFFLTQATARAVEEGRISQEQADQFLRDKLGKEPLGPPAPDPLAFSRQVDALKEQLAVQTLIAQGRKEEAAALQIVNQLKAEGTNLDPLQVAELQRLVALNAQIELAGSLFEDARDPAIQYKKEVEAIVSQMGALKASAMQVQLALRDAFLRSLEAAVSFEAGVQRAFLKMQIEAGNFAKVGEDIVNSFANSITGALDTLVETGKFSFREFASAAIADIAKIIARLLVMQALSGLFAPTVPGSPIPAGTAPFDLAGGLASGGTARAGQSYLVGEEGPELFTPRQSGTVTPNGASAPAPVVNVQSVTVMSPDLVPQAMASGKVDQQIISLIGRQKDVINRMLSS